MTFSPGIALNKTYHALSTERCQTLQWRFGSIILLNPRTTTRSRWYFYLHSVAEATQPRETQPFTQLHTAFKQRVHQLKLMLFTKDCVSLYVLVINCYSNIFLLIYWTCFIANLCFYREILFFNLLFLHIPKSHTVSTCFCPHIPN